MTDTKHTTNAKAARAFLATGPSLKQIEDLAARYRPTNGS